MEEKKKHRITLIDILVATAIIALILAIVALSLAIVLPMMNTSHPRPRRLVCASNIDQLYFGFILYQGEKENWPDKKSWCDLLKPSFSGSNGEVDKEVYLCPVDKTGPCSYAMNENIPAVFNELPGDLVFLFESAPGWNQVGGADDVVTDRHYRNGANIAFADGDVEFVEAEDIPNLRWTLEE